MTNCLRRFTVVLLALLTAAASFAQESLPDVFNRMKSEFGAGDYSKSLADVETLDALTRKAGFEKDRAKLNGPITFYRAANLAALGRRDDAREEFINFLALSPNAAITSPPFPKPVAQAFQQAQKIMAGRNNTLAVTYASFTVPAGWKLRADSTWALSPVRYLLSNEEKKTFAALATDAEREAFVANFWKAFDPTPDTPENEFRTEFERRVAFADTTFATDKTSGRESDRALIFAFLGPPSFAGASSMSASDDSIAMLRGGKATPPITSKTAGASARGFDQLTGNSGADSLETPDKLGTRESWYYRSGRIPEHVPFKELRFDFLTKEGYGEGVLQKDPNILQTLGMATGNARKDKKLN